ncbi:MAG: hypothetical protein D6820_18325, partial [Lentisphaerae bacterium]
LQTLLGRQPLNQSAFFSHICWRRSSVAVSGRGWILSATGASRFRLPASACAEDPLPLRIRTFKGTDWEKKMAA